MIRAVLVVGWLGLALLVAAGVGGYDVGVGETAERHLVMALFPTGALLFADLCVLVYLQGTLRLVRRTARELALPADWLAERRRLVRRGSLLPAASAVAIVFLFLSGFPAYTTSWPAAVHHAAFVVTAAVQLAFLLLGGRALRHSEERLAAFGAAAEAAGGV